MTLSIITHKETSSSHHFHVKTTVLEEDEGTMNSFTTLHVKAGHQEANFHFLINRGSSSCYQCFKIKEPGHSYLNENNCVSQEDIDAVLLCGSESTQVGKIINFLIHYPNVQVICTEAVLMLTKLYFYDAIFLKKTQRSFLASQNNEQLILDNDVSCWTFEDVDKALNHVKRVRYYEIITFTKEAQDAKGNPFSISLNVQAVPSGISLGSCAWHFTSEGEYAAALYADNLTIKKNRFFDGFEPTYLSRSPSIFVIGSRFNKTLDSPMEYIDQHPLVQIHPEEASSRILKFTKHILSQGGSVVIPVDLGLDALELLVLFQSSWTLSWKAYPVYFISPTTDLLVTFARTMLGWMSQRLRNDFCESRRNLFESFSSIRFMTCAQSALQEASVPCVLICTPFSLNSGGLFSLDAWISICHNPHSAILFLKPPLPEDEQYLQTNTFLYFKRLQHRSSNDSSVCNHEKHENFDLPQISTSDSKTPRYDDRMPSYSLESPDISHALKETAHVQADDYGVYLTAEEDDWADLCLPTCVHHVDEDFHCSISQAHEHTTETLFFNNFSSSSHTVLQESHTTKLPETSIVSRISRWESMLTSLQNFENGLGNYFETSKVKIAASKNIILGFYGSNAVSEIQNAQHFVEWLLPVIFLNPLHVIITPRGFTPRILPFLFSTSLQRYFPRLPSLHICCPNRFTTNQESQCANVPAKCCSLSGHCEAFVSWNELFVELQDPYILSFIKEHQKLLKIVKGGGTIQSTQNSSFLTFQNRSFENCYGIRFHDSIISLAYTPLQIHEISNASTVFHESKCLKEDEMNQFPEKLIGVKDFNETGFVSFENCTQALDRDSVTSSTPSTGYWNQSESGWIYVGRVTQRVLLDLLRDEFFSEWISTFRKGIILRDVLSIEFDVQENNHQVLLLNGGWDMTTLWFKKRLMSFLHGLGTIS